MQLLLLQLPESCSLSGLVTGSAAMWVKAITSRVMTVSQHHVQIYGSRCDVI